MINLFKLLCISTFVALAGCAHNIQIAPDLNKLRSDNASPKAANIAYYISAEDKAKQVTSPGGGGDKISYYPYKDSEGALNTILSNLYKNVYTAPSKNDAAFNASKQISYVFAPQITTTSSSNGAFTWPPTDFSLTILCLALDANGKEIWRDQVTGKGHAEFSEFKSDFPLAAKRATEDAFRQLQDKIAATPALQN